MRESFFCVCPAHRRSCKEGQVTGDLEGRQPEERIPLFFPLPITIASACFVISLLDFFMDLMDKVLMFVFLNLDPLSPFFFFLLNPQFYFLLIRCLG